MKLIDEDTCIYLDCSSNINTSKPKTISKINLLENEDFLIINVILFQKKG